MPIGIGVLVLRYVSMAFYMGTQANRMDVSVDLVDVFLSVLVSAFVFLLCLLVVRPEWGELSRCGIALSDNESLAGPDGASPRAEVMSWGVMFVAIGWLPGSRQSRPAKKGKVESISSISTLVTRLKLLKLFTFAFMLVNLIITGGPGAQQLLYSPVPGRGKRDGGVCHSALWHCIAASTQGLAHWASFYPARLTATQSWPVSLSPR